MSTIERETEKILPVKDVLEIQDTATLQSVLEDGLTTLYQSVFAGPPYFEKFSDQEVKETFTEILSGKGIIFVFKENGEVISFAAGAPLSSFGPEILKKRFAPEKTFYFAELGVKENRRRQGIGIFMTKLLINSTQEEYPLFKIFCMRTSVDNLPSIGLAKRAGLTVVPDLREFVLQERQDGSIKEDERLFMAMTL